MTETMEIPTTTPGPAASAVTSPPFEAAGPPPGEDIFESDIHESPEVLQEPVGGGEVDADSVLAYTKEHGIEEGFEFLATGEEKHEEVVEGEMVGTVHTEKQEPLVKENIDDVEKIPGEIVKDTETIEEMTLKEEVALLKKDLEELTKGQEGMKKELADVTRHLTDTMEITKGTVLVLYELVKKLHAEEEDKKRKQSLWMLLAKLAGFLTTSLLSKPEDGEKILKGEQIK